ncbi:MAG: hypothetical protein KC423_02670 [Anaerolineales bacterium]|nr:hypothetical protein [Anaerolineales bacterium]
MARFQLYNPLLQRVQRYAETAVLFRSAPLPPAAMTSPVPLTAVPVPSPQYEIPMVSTESLLPILPTETQVPMPYPAPKPSGQNDSSWRRLETILQRHQQKQAEETASQVVAQMVAQPDAGVISRAVSEAAAEAETAVQPQIQPPPAGDTHEPTTPESAASLPPLPLDKAWGAVQRTTVEEKTAVRPAAEPPVAPEQKAALEQNIQAKLADTHTAQPTQSAVEIHLPRRQRPGVMPPPKPAPPAPPRPAQTEWVEIEDIGRMPSDLWGLIGEVPPTERVIAPETQIAQPPTIARQAVEGADAEESVGKTAVLPLTQPNIPPAPPSAPQESEQQRPFHVPASMTFIADDRPSFALPKADVARAVEPKVTEPARTAIPVIQAQPVRSALDQPEPEMPRPMVPTPFPHAPEPVMVPIAKVAPAQHPDMAVASPTIVQRFAAPASYAVDSVAAPSKVTTPNMPTALKETGAQIFSLPEASKDARGSFLKGRVFGETAVLPMPYPALPITPEPLPKVGEEETAVQTKPKPIQQAVGVVERVMEERPLLQKMPLDAIMQPFMGAISDPFSGLVEEATGLLPEAGQEAAEADEAQEDEAGVIDELAQHVYRQLRQQLATDWERRRTR